MQTLSALKRTVRTLDLLSSESASTTNRSESNNEKTEYRTSNMRVDIHYSAICPCFFSLFFELPMGICSFFSMEDGDRGSCGEA